MGFKLAYTSGAVVGLIDYQSSHNSPGTGTVIGATTVATGNANSFDRTAIKYGLGYKYAGAANPSIVSAQMWNKKRTDLTAPTAALVLAGGTTGLGTLLTGSGKDSGYGFSLEHDLGSNSMLVAQWGKANSLKDKDGTEMADTGATAYTLGYRKALSKRTHVYTAYHTIKNDKNVNYNMSGGNYSSAANVANGAQIKMMALGMQHDF